MWEVLPLCMALLMCRFSHPPFDLPSGPTPPSPIARPSSDAELINIHAQPLPPVPPPPHAPTAPGPKELRNRSQNATSQAQLQPKGPESGKQVHEVMQPPPPPPPPPPPRAKLEHRPSQAADAAPAPAAQPAERPAGSVWPVPQQDAQQQQGDSGTPVQPAEQSLSSQDPVIQWAPPSSAGANEGSAAPTAAGQLSRRASAAAAAMASMGQQQDVVVPPPKRTASLSKLQAPSASAEEPSALPAWQQLGSWGPSSLVSAAAAAASAPQADPPATSESFHPFGEHPLQRALASQGNQDPVVPAPARPQAKAPPQQQPPPQAQPHVNQQLLDFSRTPAKKPLGHLAGPAATHALPQPSVAAMSSMAPLTGVMVFQPVIGLVTFCMCVQSHVYVDSFLDHV